MNTDKILKKTQEDYSIIASHFSEKRRFVWGDLKPFLKSIKHGDKVLDAGCGNGRLYQALENKKIEYLGIDFSKNLLRIAKKFNPGVEFRQGDISKKKTWSDLKDYDVICCIAVLHHFPTKKEQLKVLEYIFQALKPNGLLIITVWNLWQKRFWGLHLKQIFWKIIKGFKFKWLLVPYKMTDKGKVVKVVNRFCYAFTTKEFEKIVKKAGFSIVKKKYGRNLCLVGKKW